MTDPATDIDRWLAEHVMVGTDKTRDDNYNTPRLIVNAGYFSMSAPDAERFARHILKLLEEWKP